MFHTLSELKEKEKNKGKQAPKNSLSSMPKERSPEDNYYGKGNKAYDYYNKKPSESLNTKFAKTKTKITLIVFQNGFIINNGPFRDRAIPENQKFMEQVEKGNIPHELMDKGINDLGILLINRKNEIYHQPIGPITHITQITQINPINPITINPNMNSYNQYTNYDNIFNNYTYNYILNTQSKYNEQYEQLLNQVLYNNNNSSNISNNNNTNNQYQYQYQYNNNSNNQYSNDNNQYQYSNSNNQYQYSNSNNQYHFNSNDIINSSKYNNNNQYQYNTSQFNIDDILNTNNSINNSINNNNINNSIKYNYNTYNANENNFSKNQHNYSQYNLIQTPIGIRSVRKEIRVPTDRNVIPPNTENRNYIRKERHTSSVPKKETPKNKFETFHNFKRNELIKEEEEKKRKNKNKEKVVKEPEKKEEKKFKAFGGVGQVIGAVNIEGLNVQPDLKNSININKPTCIINIRLFDGEIARGEFNYTQTLRDIYFYVRKISGSNNFTLLDGFPPKALRDYDKTIGQLRLENPTLTQRLNQ